MKIRPINRKVLIKRIEEEVKKGSIIIPDTVKEKPQKGQVIEVAKVKKDDDPMQVKKGDKVLFGKYSGNEVEINDEEYLLMSEEDILGVIEK